MKNLNPYLTIFFCLFISPLYCFGNTGVFYGSGNQVIPIKNDQIQLVKEYVTIKLSIDENNSQFGIPFIPWANVKAIFYLQNTEDKVVDLHIGFPFLDLQGFGDEKFVLENLNFKVLSNEESRNAELKEGLIEAELDPEGYFKKVFVWDENFKPYQKRTIIVSYKLLMGVEFANSNLRTYDPIGEKFDELDKLFSAINYSFSYITSTAYTWKGDVLEASFEIDAQEFFERLESKEYVSSFNYNRVKFNRPIFLKSVSPDTFIQNNYSFKWKFHNQIPGEGISFNIITVFAPSLPEEVQPFLKKSISLLKKTKPQEFISVTKQYYHSFISEAPIESDFLKKYFKEVWFSQSDCTLLFQSDEERIAEILQTKLK